jgi:hypothetical protein
MTTHGGPLPNNSATNANLNPLRVWRELPNLQKSEPQQLIGSNVKIVEIDGPVRAPPTRPNGADFEFDARTNEFAAVAAYYNCDRFFTFVESLGFKRDDYFPWTEFPIPIDHRGAPMRGGASNDAQTRGNPRIEPDGTEVKVGIKSVVFALAQPDRDPPALGNANDWRLVLHELGGHGTLVNHVASTHFRFAHSAGDSLAAILNDPESNAPSKDETFPWLPPYDRWHNRRVDQGWGWDGPRDDSARDLDQEQILSTAHFRLYQAIGGGNALQVDARRFAAKHAAYLILRAIQTLTPPTNPQHASDWMYNLIVADAGDWSSEGHYGGAFEKVIWWAFQKQNLFGGDPPPVDIYIDDGRDGEYQFTGDFANCPAIWNRLANDGAEGHQAPAPNLVNYAYVKIKNRGSQPATSVAVQAFQSSSRASRIYPDDWVPMRTPRLRARDVAPHSSELIVGPFEWIPAAGDNTILMAASANGDPSNLSKFTAGKSIPDWRLVPHDNNLGMRKV